MNGLLNTTRGVRSAGFRFFAGSRLNFRDIIVDFRPKYFGSCIAYIPRLVSFFMWFLPGIFGVIAHVLCYSEANAPLIERWIMKKALGGALAVERFFRVRDGTGVAVSVAHREGFVAQAEQDVEPLVDAMIEIHVSEEESLKLRRMYYSNRSWEYLALLQDEDDQEVLFAGMGKRFSSFLEYMHPRLGSFLETSSPPSTDLLEEKKIYEYLERSFYNDMFDWVRRTDPLDGIRFTFRAKAATAVLAKTTFELINSDAISVENKRLIIDGLLEVASKNGLNEVFFANTARRKRGEIIEYDRDYLPVSKFMKKQIVEFSKIVEGVVESSTLRDALKNIRVESLEETKKLV